MTCTEDSVFDAQASSQLFSVPAAIFLCAQHATEDRQVFLYSLCEICVCVCVRARMRVCVCVHVKQRE